MARKKASWVASVKKREDSGSDEEVQVESVGSRNPSSPVKEEDIKEEDEMKMAVLLNYNQQQKRKLEQEETHGTTKKHAMRLPKSVPSSVKSIAHSSPWPPGTFTSNLRIYRHWVFVGHESNDDKYSRKPALFALKMNCIYKSNWFLPSTDFPIGNDYDAEQARDFFQNDENLRYARVHGFFQDLKPGQVTLKWNTDDTFSTMPQGSIVCMVIPNKTGQQEACFGIIQSGNTFRIESQESCPVELTGCAEGTLLYHRVQWLCWAKLRSLPGNTVCKNGAKMVKWLVECIPKCVVELKNTNKAQALHYLQSEEFFECASTDFGGLLEEADRMLEP
ncbi:expressed unknown protein [Seminavis robusta]|uniref:Uncharacterized protein n=1 Tax=Seminavis robusta TaxID=568900 RepID=A0A9N8H738_9STRA|nr:expressed unknown protein [Seminavis robusta]|eukprot:Sro118_g057680.1 n/a (334) ;mRNA; f:37312-38313